MARKGRAQLRALTRRVQEVQPNLDALDAIRRGVVRVDGRIVTNPRSLVLDGARVAIVPRDVPLRGEAKLEHALKEFGVSVRGRIALDLGAAAGGFTRALLRAGAARVYAVDTGYGQLLGSLRQDPFVVNLERTNIADLTVDVVPDEVEVVTVDLAYLSLAAALPQLSGRVSVAPRSELIALIKPMYELRLSAPPLREGDLRRAVDQACTGAAEAGWDVRGMIRSPVEGQRGAIEFLLHARLGRTGGRRR